MRLRPHNRYWRAALSAATVAGCRADHVLRRQPPARAHACVCRSGGPEAVSARRGQEVDLLLAKWDQAWAKLAAAEGAYEASGCRRRPQHRAGCCGSWGPRRATLALALASC